MLPASDERFLRRPNGRVCDGQMRTCIRACPAACDEDCTRRWLDDALDELTPLRRALLS